MFNVKSVCEYLIVTLVLKEFNYVKSHAISCIKPAPGSDIKNHYSKINCSMEVAQTCYGIALEFDYKPEIMQNDAMLKTSLNCFSFSYREKEASVEHLELRETEYVVLQCCKNLKTS